MEIHFLIFAKVPSGKKWKKTECTNFFWSISMKKKIYTSLKVRSKVITAHAHRRTLQYCYNVRNYGYKRTKLKTNEMTVFEQWMGNNQFRIDFSKGTNFVQNWLNKDWRMLRYYKKNHHVKLNTIKCRFSMTSVLFCKQKKNLWKNKITSCTNTVQKIAITVVLIDAKEPVEKSIQVLEIRFFQFESIYPLLVLVFENQMLWKLKRFQEITRDSIWCSFDWVFVIPLSSGRKNYINCVNMKLVLKNKVIIFRFRRTFGTIEL